MTPKLEVREPVAFHDILVAWQARRLPYGPALALTGMSTVTELYQAATDSGVEIRTRMLPSEARTARRGFEAIGTAKTPSRRGA